METPDGGLPPAALPDTVDTGVTTRQRAAATAESNHSTYDALILAYWVLQHDFEDLRVRERDLGPEGRMDLLRDMRIRLSEHRCAVQALRRDVDAAREQARLARAQVRRAGDSSP